MTGGMLIFSPAPDIQAAICDTGSGYSEQHESGIALLTELLKSVYGIELTENDIVKTPEGKPYLANRPEIYFNITHTTEYAAAAVSARAVGIDIERIRPSKPALAKRWLTPFVDLDPYALDDLSFTRAWTMFESYTKMTGRGLAESDFTRPHSFYEYGGNGYILTICAENRDSVTDSFR